MNQAQLREFVTHGVVSLPSFLTAAQLEHYRAQAWAQLAPEANDGEDVLDGRGGGTSLGLTPSLDELPQMHALLQQISDGRFTPEHEREVTQAFCKVTLPASEAAVPLPAPGTVGGGNVPFESTVGHIDGYNPRWVGSARPAGGAGTMVTVVVYVEDVDSHGGGYCYWRGGCHRVHAFFRAQPHVVDGRFVREDEFQQHGWAGIYGGDAARTENVARAGDALLVHGWTPHSASRNMRSSPRMAIIQRWNDKRLSLGSATQEEKDEFEAKVAAGAPYTDTERYGEAHAVPRELFEHWGAEIREAAAATRDRAAAAL
jgi:hypothetical protein